MYPPHLAFLLRQTASPSDGVTSNQLYSLPFALCLRVHSRRRAHRKDLRIDSSRPSTLQYAAHLLALHWFRLYDTSLSLSRVAVRHCAPTRACRWYTSGVYFAASTGSIMVQPLQIAVARCMS